LSVEKNYMNKIIATRQSIVNQSTERSDVRPWLMIICTLAFLLCILLTVTPIARIGHLQGVSYIMDIATPARFSPLAMPFLTVWGKWLPQYFSSSSPDGRYLTANFEVLLFIALAFVVYVVTAYLIGRRALPVQMRVLRRWMWIGTIVAGLFFVLTPGMASKDLFVYADYGNLVGAHGANPYFTTPAQIAHGDLLTLIDGWSNVPSAYGPVWVYLSGLLSLIFGDHPLPYFYIYRLIALTCHILNIVLIGQILRKLGRSERIITLGMFLYAWNPLMLFEGPLGAHNDVFMSTLMLWGLLLCLRADQRGFTKLKNYWPGLVVLTLAVLVKFTSIPLIIFFLLVLAARTLGSPQTPVRAMPWIAAIKNVLIAGAIFVVLVVLAYLPYWIGHSIGAIVQSFGAPPSSSGAQNSLMRVAINLINAGGASGGIVNLLASRKFWSLIDALAIGIAVLVGAWYAWRSPSLRTLILGSLATMTIILLVTPWFYSWYVVWLIALVPLALAFPNGRFIKALLAFCLTFSATAFVTYISVAFLHTNGYQLAVRYLLMIVPPIVIAIGVYIFSSADLEPVVENDPASQSSASVHLDEENASGNRLINGD
jgi:hypothetical protein